LSHELRTPLNTLLGWIQLLRTGQLVPDRQRRALDAIERSAELQARLTADLLDVSAAVKGKLRLDRRQIAPSPLIEGVVDLLRPDADRKGLSLRSSIEPDLPALWADAARVQQIVWNLLSNAIRLTPPGGAIDVLASRDNGAVAIVVSDTGIGISPAFLPYVFDRFRQADSGPTRAHAGLGLGLAIVRQLVEMHGGEVGVQSEGDQKGATFTVRLPAAANVTVPGTVTR
jgi:signal transduction histidine kinase